MSVTYAQQFIVQKILLQINILQQIFLRFLSLQVTNPILTGYMYLENSWAKLCSLEFLPLSRIFCRETFIREIHKKKGIHTYNVTHYTVVIVLALQSRYLETFGLFSFLSSSIVEFLDLYFNHYS